MFIVGYIWLNSMIKKEVAKGGHFVAKEGEQTAQLSEDEMPECWSFFRSFNCDDHPDECF